MKPCSECGTAAFGVYLTLASDRVLCSPCWRARDLAANTAAGKREGKR